MARTLISGASGLIGSALVPSLESAGHEVKQLVRRSPSNAKELHWDPMRPIAPELVAGWDAVIHLSGENVAGRWTGSKKKRIRESRVTSTRNLAQALALSEKKPEVFLCASAIGYYGSRGDEVLTEESASGDGFLAEVCREWEGATAPAADAGIRVVNLRFGIVLSGKGGALTQMLLPFRLALGGRIGSGRQWWTWIHVDDLVAAVRHILENTPERRASTSVPSLNGPVNVVSLSPVTNADFTKALAQALHRPAILPMPAVLARLAFGELADEGLLASAKVLPKKLTESGFDFQFPSLTSALGQLL